MTEKEIEAYKQGRKDKAEEIVAFVRTDEFMSAWINCPLGTRFGDFVAEQFLQKES